MTACVTSAALLVMMPSTSAWAQDKKELDDDTKQRVLGYIKGANAFYKEERYEEALKLYEEAYAVYPNPSLLYRMGQAAQKSGDLRGAIKYFEAMLTEAPDNPKAAEVTQLVAQIKEQVPPRVTITSQPTGANVRFGSPNSPVVGSTPYEAEVEKGSLVVYLKLDGYETSRQEVEMGPAAEETIDVKLKAAEVVEDPVSSSTEGSGGGALGTLGLVGAGAGVATLAVGGVFTLLQFQATDAVNNYDKTRPPLAGRRDIETLKDEANAHYSTSLVLYSVGGALTALGVGLFVFDSFAGGDNEASVSVVPTEGGGVVQFGARF